MVVTRAREQAGPLAAQLLSLGAEPLICPAIQISPPPTFNSMDAAIARLAEFEWIVFTSANGVTALVDRMNTLGRERPDPMPNVAVVGAATARAAEAQGFAVTAMPERYVAESLVETFGDLSGDAVLLIRADIARPTMLEGLRNRGAIVEDVVAYRTVPGDGISELGQALQAGTVDAVTFSSSSTVRYFVQGLQATGSVEVLTQDATGPAVICLGPITASAARACGLRVDAIADTFDADGLTDALIAWFDGREKSHE